jgi:hypothetical protein
MHQGSGRCHHGGRGDQGKRRRLVAPFNSICTQARGGQLTVLVRVTTKS